MIVVAVAVVLFVVISSGGKETPAPASLDPVAEAGKALYVGAGNCNGCHPGQGRQGGLAAPRLSTSNVNDAATRQYIRSGKGMMPGNSNLSDDDITKIISYLHAIKAAAG
jgi:mono/diheme cytochrome c family protein